MVLHWQNFLKLSLVELTGKICSQGQESSNYSLQPGLPPVFKQSGSYGWFLHFKWLKKFKEHFMIYENYME